MIDASAYTIIVQKVVIDGESVFEARVDELPDLRDYAESSNEAYELAVDSIRTAAAIFSEKKMDFPQPKKRPLIEASGRVTLRLPKSLHAQLIRVADEEDTSLNQHIVSVLSVDYGKHLSSTQQANFAVFMYPGLARNSTEVLTKSVISQCTKLFQLPASAEPLLAPGGHPALARAELDYLVTT